MKYSLKPVAYFIMLAIANPGYIYAATPGIPDHGNAMGAGVTFNESVGPSSGPVLDINVSLPNSVIDWNGAGFNVGSDGTVNFNSSAGPTSILNYDKSGSRSVIDGVVNHGGNRLFLVNPNGISDSSGAFSALISNDHENVTFGSGGRLRIIKQGSGGGSYGSIIGNANKEFDLDIELLNGSGLKDSNMTIGGNVTTVAVQNEASPMELSDSRAKFRANETIFISETEGGSISFDGLNADSVKLKQFANTHFSGSLNINGVDIEQPSGNTRISNAQGSIKNLSVNKGSLEIDSNSPGGVLLIEGLTHRSVDSTTSLKASQGSKLDIRNINIDSKTSSGAGGNFEANAADGEISILNGKISAENEMSFASKVDLEGLQLNNYKKTTFSGRDTGFKDVVATTTRPEAQLILTDSTGTYENLEVNGGVVIINSNVQDGVLNLNGFKHHAEVGGTHLNISKNSTLNISNIDINLNSELEISDSSKYDQQEISEAGADNRFTATASGTGGTLNINKGDIFVEKGAIFGQETGAKGSLYLTGVPITARSADIEIVKNTEFNLVNSGSGSALFLISDQNLQNTDNKGLILVDDAGLRSQIDYSAPKVYTEADVDDHESEHWAWSSEEKILIDWDKVTVDQIDIKEDEKSFMKDSGDGGGDVLPPDTNIDPETGWPIDPETGLPVNPDNGAPVDPDTGWEIDPETGWLIDPNTGWPIDPETGYPVNPDLPPIDPDTGWPIDPETGEPVEPGTPVDPDTGWPIDPETGWPIDPETGWPIDPETGEPVEPVAPVDPDTGWPIDPETGWPIDPETGEPVDPGTPIDPETGWPIDPETGWPIDPETGSPVEPGVDPVPVDPDTGWPIDPETGYPIDPDTGAPIDPDTGWPIDPEQGGPITPEIPIVPVDPVDPDVSIDPETGYPVDPETGHPIDPETGNPIIPETPVDPETGWPIDPDSGYPIDPETGDPVDPETSWPIDPETGWPIDPETGIPTEPETNPGASNPGASEMKRNWFLEYFFGSSSRDRNEEEDEKKRKKAEARAKAKAKSQASDLAAKSSGGVKIFQ